MQKNINQRRKENINQEFSFKKIDEIRNWVIEEINQNEWMSKKHKKVYRVLYCIEHTYFS